MSFNHKITLFDAFRNKNLDNCTIESIVSILQPNYSGVLYVINNVLYVAPTVEECVARLRKLKHFYGASPRFHLADELNNPNPQWVVRVSNDPRNPSIWLSNKDVVDQLITKPK